MATQVDGSTMLSTGIDVPVRTGARFGTGDKQFELGEELGSGAAARVYVCKHLRTGDQLAAKIINLQRLRLLGDFDAHMEKLDREVTILRELTHPRIVRLHYVHRTQSSVFLVMELVRGGELFDRIVQHRSLSEVEAKYIFRQLLEGVGYMHSKHVIHRDLKPENILIASSQPAEPPAVGSLLDVKIADFGLSKIISEETSWAKTFVGTPQYWAPEVLKVQAGGGSYTQAVDFWSLGAVLFVMLCGRYPFDGKKMPLEEQIRTGTYNMSTAAWQKVSEEAKSMVRGLLVVDPSQRFTLQRCLTHPWLAGAATPAPAPTTPISRTSSVAYGSMSGMPMVTEVSGSNIATNATPLVTQPSVASGNSSSGSAGASSRKPSTQEPPPKQDGPRSPQSLQVSGSDCPHETIFCLNELLKLQVSIAGSLEMAALAFRHTDIELAEAIRKTIRQARDLSSAAVNVVSRYAQVAQQVSNDVLPDLELAVQEKEPSLAHSLLAMVKEWVSNMKQDGQEIQCLYHGLQESVHSLITRAQRTKLGADRALVEAMQAEAPFLPSPRSQLALKDSSSGKTPANTQVGGSLSSSAPSPTNATGIFAPGGAVSFAPRSANVTAEAGASNTTAMNNWTHQLFEQLSKMHLPKAIQDQSLQTGDGGNATSTMGSDDGASCAQFTHVDSEQWKRDVLELLFMAPGISTTQLPRVESVGAYEADINSRQPSSCGECAEAEGGEGMVPNGSDTTLVRYMPGVTSPSAADAMSQSSASLLRALRELKRVDEILEGCAAFWANMDGTVQKLAQMKEHTDCLINFAAKSQPLRERFEQRLREYTNFWSALECLCRQYCVDHQASAKRMYEVIREVSDAADVIDTANSARLGLLSAMREKQRRHGY